MKILLTNRELSVEDEYFLTRNPGANKMSVAAGGVLECAAWCIFEDWNEREEKDVEVFSCITTDGECFATNSPTFIREIRAMYDLFTVGHGVPIIKIKIEKKTAKSGREFLTAIYSK